MRDGVRSADVILNLLARRRDPVALAISGVLLEEPLEAVDRHNASGNAASIQPITIITPHALRLQHEPAADCVRYDTLGSASRWNELRSSGSWAS